MDKKFSYITAKEFGNYNYIKAPKELVYSPKCRVLSGDARFLYIAMLDRLSLSILNNRVDDDGNVYIIMSHKDIKRILGCSDNKVTKLLAELDIKEGAGLIKKIRRGLGHPDVIYINSHPLGNESDNTDEKPTTQPDEEDIPETIAETNDEETKPEETNPKETNPEETNPEETNSDSDLSYAEESQGITPTTTEYELTETAQSQINEMCSIKNTFSEFAKNEVQNSPDLHTNNKYNKNKINKLKFNNSSSPVGYDEWIYERNQTIEFFKDVIGYEALVNEYDPIIIDDIVTVLTDASDTVKPYLKIGGEYIPSRHVRRKLFSVDYGHIQEVCEGLLRTTTEILNMRSYLLTAIYNSIVVSSM